MKILVPYTVELEVEIECQGYDAEITRVTVGGVDITAACEAQPKAWGWLQAAAEDGMAESEADEADERGVRVW